MLKPHFTPRRVVPKGLTPVTGRVTMIRLVYGDLKHYYPNTATYSAARDVVSSLWIEGYPLHLHSADLFAEVFGWGELKSIVRMNNR